MKYVFVINSHTTFLTSMGTVDYLGLKPQDVVLCYMRNYKNSITPVECKVVECTALFNSCSNFMDNYHDKVKSVDDFVNQNISERYNLYIPHLSHWFFQLLYTNPKCRRVSYVQEGGAVQMKMFQTNEPFFKRLKLRIRLALRLWRVYDSRWYIDGCIYKQLRLDSYAINDSYFHYLPSNNHIVKWPIVKVDIKIDAAMPIFIFDGYVGNGLMEKDVYINVCEDIISEHAKSRNYVKFHPAQSKEECNTILSLFRKHGVEAVVMSNDIPMEYIVIQFNKLTFVGFTSSLIYYAHDFKHNVICCENLILQHSKKFREYKEECGFLTYAETYGDGAK